MFSANNEKLKEELVKHKISYINLKDPDYPALLKETFDPPKTLYYQGSLPKKNIPMLAVVGSRKMTSYGQTAIARILPPLIKSGITIVSGLAFGIDGESHRLSLENNGVTHAVIGSGLDQKSFYPQVNYRLANEIIASGGCVLSEYPPGTPPMKHHFPMRNRIIAGLSCGVLIIEAVEGSGSLITASYALNENREVFAVPGFITSRANQGTNNLIKEGAHLVSSPGDILSVLGLSETYNTATLTDNYLNDPLLRLISDEPRHIDLIARKLHLTTQEVSARLSQLEIKGLVKNVGGMNYIIIKYT